MDNRDFLKNIGRQVQRGVRQVTSSKSFHEIKHTIDGTIREVMNNQNHNWASDWAPTTQTEQTSSSATAKPAALQSKVFSKENVISILLLTFGFMGLGIFGLCLLIILATIPFLLAATVPGSIALISIFTLLTAASGIMVAKGFSVRGYYKRFKAYISYIGDSKFCPITDLASVTQKKVSYTVKDLLKMIRKGLLPTAHLDAEQTCLILDHETYREYLHTKNLMSRRKEEAQQFNSTDPLQSAIAEGRQYIRQIRAANDAIPGEEISQKIDELEIVTAKIFEYISKRPEKLPQIRRFMSYYLPTTLKLLQAYQEFDAQPIQGENIKSAKTEISDTLDTITVAFKNLLDSLFEHEAMDISTDISALETMLAQEGLTEDGMKTSIDEK